VRPGAAGGEGEAGQRGGAELGCRRDWRWGREGGLGLVRILIQGSRLRGLSR